MGRAVRRTVLGVLVLGLVVAGATGVYLFTEDRHDDGPDAVEISRSTGSTDDGWQVVAYSSLTLEVPPDWARFETGDCESPRERWGPADLDPCVTEVGLSFFASASFDPATGPGVHSAPPSATLPDGGWAGYVARDDLVVNVVDTDQEVVRRILRSVRRGG